MAKSKENYKINFIGNNAVQVTGSMTLLTINETRILVDCGMSQSSNVKQDFIINSKLPKEIKPKKLDYCFITHNHADHVGLIPLLVKSGYEGKIFIPKKGYQIAKKMLMDSAYIVGRNATMLEREPYYSMEDVFQALSQIEELDFNFKYPINDDCSVELLQAGHILSSAQFLFYAKKNHSEDETKILFTGDLGNIKCKGVWDEEFQPCPHAHVVVGECTYNRPERTIKAHTRAKDREKMKAVIDTVMDKGGKVLIPSFSYSRTQVILEEIWQLYHDTKFPYRVVIDSPLSVSLTTLYEQLLEGEQKEHLKEILKWENLILSSEHKVHENLKELGRPMVVIASSGFLDFGRSNSWIKKILPSKSCHVLFVGYASPTSIAGKIKSYEKKEIKIGGETLKNRCGITCLNSFSSHAQYDDLLNYYSSMDAEKVYLVHGEMKGKLEFAKTLAEKISKNNKTTKVVAVNKGTIGKF